MSRERREQGSLVMSWWMLSLAAAGVAWWLLDARLIPPIQDWPVIAPAWMAADLWWWNIAAGPIGWFWNAPFGVSQPTWRVMLATGVGGWMAEHAPLPPTPGSKLKTLSREDGDRLRRPASYRSTAKARR